MGGVSKVRKGIRSIIREILDENNIWNVASFAKEYTDLAPSTVYDMLKKEDLQYTNLGSLHKLAKGLRNYGRRTGLDGIWVPDSQGQVKKIGLEDFSLEDLYIEEDQAKIDLLEFKSKILTDLTRKKDYDRILDFINGDLDLIYKELLSRGRLDNFVEYIEDLINLDISDTILREEEKVVFALVGEAYIDAPDGRSGYLPLALKIELEEGNYRILNGVYSFDQYYMTDL